MIVYVIGTFQPRVYVFSYAKEVMCSSLSVCLSVCVCFVVGLSFNRIEQKNCATTFQDDSCKS